MKNRRIALFLAFTCVLSIGVVQSKDTVKSDSIPSEEYEVYAVVLDRMVGGVSYVVIDTTSIHGDVKELDHALSFPAEFEELVTPDLMKDISNKNKQRYAITQQFPKDLRVTLLSEREESEIFRDSTKDGWQTFRSKYMSSSGITRLSRVGFNKNHDVAAVYVGNVAGWEMGRGAYLLLQKVEGKWKVLTETRGWIS